MTPSPSLPVDCDEVRGPPGKDSCSAKAPLPDFISSLDFGADLVKTIFNSRTPLGNFCRQFMTLHMMGGSHCPSKQLWPCPVPESLTPATELISGRRRSRFRLRAVVREHLRVFISACNWLVTGRNKAVSGPRQPMSPSQMRMVDELETMVRLFYRLSPGPSSGLDRALGKSTNIQDALSSLSGATAVLRNDLDSYCRGRSSRRNFDDVDCRADVAESNEFSTSSTGSSQIGTGLFLPPDALQGGMAVKLQADRIVFTHSPKFVASRFITDPLLKAGFEDPAHLQLPREDWPKAQPVSVLCDSEELLRLFKKWDDVHSFRLLDSSCSERLYRCGLFAVYKNSEKDRQILNPIPENGRSMKMNHSTLSLSHGSLLCGIYLEEDKDLIIGADDLEDFYHCFVVSSEHAHRNHIHGVFPAEIFRGWNCWDEQLSGKHVVGCFSTLAMGTGFAVEVAQHTHSVLLQRAGCLSNDQWIQYRKELPRGDTFQLLCIDDYGVLQKVPRGMPAASHQAKREDHRLLNLANNAYNSVGLRSSSKKAVRDSYKCTLLGGEVDGRLGLVNAPRLRILMLCRLTLQLVSIGYATKQLLETIIGSWIFVLMFRRPLLSLLSDVFHEGGSLGQREIFQLSTGSKQELLLLCVVAPFAYTNLRASPINKVFCSDASMAGGGVCVAPVSESVTLELCRAAEQRGFYTRIDGSVLGSYMALRGCDIVAEREIPQSLSEGFLWDFCEVFRGTGHLSAAHRALGLRVHPGFDIADGAKGNVLKASTFSAIIGLICRRVVKSWHAGPVCTTFGTLRRPRLRSKLEPFGFNPSDPATSQGNQFAMRGGFILFLCFFYDLLVSIEQPGGSVMYRLDIYQRLLQRGFLSIRFPFCNWGTPFQKSSWWLSNNEHLAVLTDHCRCGQKGSHFRIQGVFDSARMSSFLALCKPSALRVFGKAPSLHEHVAKFSAGYPIPLCELDDGWPESEKDVFQAALSMVVVKNSR